MSSAGKGRFRGGGVYGRRPTTSGSTRDGVDSTPSLTPYPTTRLEEEEEEEDLTQPPSPSAGMDTMSPESDMGSSSTTKELDPNTFW